MLNFTNDQLRQIVEWRGPNNNLPPIPPGAPAHIFQLIVERRAELMNIALPTETLEEAIDDRNARRVEVAALQAGL